MTNQTFNVKVIKNTGEYGQFAISPLDQGYGYTLGHAMRRMLLTSIPGSAITSVKINGVKHKFSTLPGLKENIVDFILNLKGVSVKLNGTKKATLKISVKGPKEITAKDIEASEGAEIINKDHYLGYMSEKKLEVELIAEEGYGYSLAEERKGESLGEIPIDAIYTPIQRVNYKVQTTRVGRRTDLDELIIEIWTNGSIDPKTALEETAKILSSYFIQMYEQKSVTPVENVAISPTVSEDLLKMTIDELDLPTRIFNSLKNGGIETVGQLLGTQRKDLVSMRNMGAKSISVIEEKLRGKGISLTV